MPVALISTRTSPAFGPSRSSSTISSGFLASNATAARVFMVLILSCSASLLRAHTGILRLGVGRRLVFVLGGAHPRDCVVGPSPQVDEDVVEVAGYVRIVAEGRHHVFLRCTDVLAATRDDGEEFAVAHGLQRVLQRRRVTRSHAVRSMTHV